MLSDGFIKSEMLEVESIENVQVAKAELMKGKRRVCINYEWFQEMKDLGV